MDLLGNDNERLLVIDGHSLAFRAFYGYPADRFRTPQGFPTNAVYGFLTMLTNTISREEPSHIAVAFDVKGGTFRHAMLDGYKGTRKRPDPEILMQIPVIQRMLELLNITHIEMPGYEGDDIVGTLATLGSKQDMEVQVLSGDRDVFQLIDDHVTVLYPTKHFNDLQHMNAEAVFEKYRVTPQQYCDLAAIRGEQSDNIIGVHGVANVTAAKWLQEYGTLDNLLDHAHEIKGKKGQALCEAVERVRLNRRVNALVRDLDLPISIEQLELDAPQIDAFRDMAQRGLHFGNTLIAKITKVLPTEQIFAGDKQDLLAHIGQEFCGMNNPEPQDFLEAVETQIRIAMEEYDRKHGVLEKASEESVSEEVTLEKPENAEQGSPSDDEQKSTAILNQSLDNLDNSDNNPDNLVQNNNTTSVLLENLNESVDDSLQSQFPQMLSHEDSAIETKADCALKQSVSSLEHTVPTATHPVRVDSNNIGDTAMDSTADAHNPSHDNGIGFISLFPNIVQEFSQQAYTENPSSPDDVQTPPPVACAREDDTESDHAHCVQEPHLQTSAVEHYSEYAHNRASDNTFATHKSSQSAEYSPIITWMMEHGVCHDAEQEPNKHFTMCCSTSQAQYLLQHGVVVQAVERINANHPYSLASVLFEAPDGAVLRVDLPESGEKKSTVSQNNNFNDDVMIQHINEAFSYCQGLIMVHDLKTQSHCFASYGVQCPSAAFDTNTAAYVYNSDLPCMTIADLASQMDSQWNEFVANTPPSDIADNTDDEHELSLFDDFNPFAEIDKSVQEDFWRQEEERYIAYYTDVARFVRTATAYFINKYLNNDNQLQWQLFQRIEMPLSSMLFAMEDAGTAIDVSRLTNIFTMFETEAEQAETLTNKLIETPINLQSHQQVRAVLQNHFGLHKGEKLMTSAQVLQDLYLETVHQEEANEFIGALLRHRSTNKLKQVTQSLLDAIAEDNCLHTTFEQTVTATGRLSSTNPNLQNIPNRGEEGREIRSAFVPREGFTQLISADYSQVELRIMAHCSQDQALIDAFQSGVDFHKYVASMVCKVPIDEVTDQQRTHVKALSYGLAYGLSSFGLSQQLHVSMQQARELKKQYFATFGAVHEYLETLVARASQCGYTETMFGRRRYFPDLLSDDSKLKKAAMRAALNAPIQGSAADIMKIAMLQVQFMLEHYHCRSRVLVQIHDELLVEVAQGEELIVPDIIRLAMEHAVTLSVPLDVSVGVGDNWLNAAH